MLHSFLPVCLLEQFSLVWVLFVFLYLFLPLPSHTPLSVFCFWWGLLLNLFIYFYWLCLGDIGSFCDFYLFFGDHFPIILNGFGLTGILFWISLSLRHIGDSSGYFASPLPSLVVYFSAFYLGISNNPLAEMGNSLLSEPPLTAEPAPSSAAATPTPAAAEPEVSLAPPTSTAAATSPGATNTDLLGGQWASRKFSIKGITLGSSALKFTSQHENTD